jgi:hypothetical protein
MKGNRHPKASYQRNTPAHLLASAGLHVQAALRALDRTQVQQQGPYQTGSEHSAGTTARVHTARAIGHLQDATENIKVAHHATRSAL